MNISRYIKNNIEIEFDRAILDNDLNSDENETFLNCNNYTIGCDICGSGHILPFNTNIFDFINKKHTNLHDLKITNCNENYSILLENYYICKKKEHFKTLEDISKKINKQKSLYRISKNKIISEKKCKTNTCFQLFKNKEFKDNNIDNVKEVIICDTCADWIRFLHPDIYNDFIKINPLKLFWRYFFKNIEKYIIFKNSYEKTYLLNELQLNNINILKEIIIN